MNIFLKLHGGSRQTKFVSFRFIIVKIALSSLSENVAAIDLNSFKTPLIGRQTAFERVISYRLLLGFFLFGCPLVNVVHGQQYQVAGTLQTSWYDQQGKQIRNDSSKFNVEVATNGWEITIYPDNKSFGDFNRVSFDGTNMYALHDIESSVANMRKSGASVAKNIADGSVLIKEVPHDDTFDGIGQIWIAYASAAYFEKYTNGDRMEMPYCQTTGAPVFLNQNANRRAFWEFANGEPKLPHTAFYLGEHGDFTNAAFITASSKTFENLELPLKATFDIFYDPLSINKQAGQQVLRIRYLILATQFDKLQNVISLPPSVPGITVVIDNRFDNSIDKIPTVLYWVDKQFLTKDEVGKLPKDSRNNFLNLPDGNIYKTATPVNRSLAKLFLTIFIIINGLFLINYVIRKKRKTKLTNKNKSEI